MQHIQALNEHSCAHKLLITSSNLIPTEVYNKVISHREGLEIHNEEADIIVTSQASTLSALKNDVHIKVISDGADVFLFVMLNYADNNLNCALIMKHTQSYRASIEIKLEHL